MARAAKGVPRIRADRTFSQTALKKTSKRSKFAKRPSRAKETDDRGYTRIVALWKPRIRIETPKAGGPAGARPPFFNMHREFLGNGAFCVVFCSCLGRFLVEGGDSPRYKTATKVPPQRAEPVMKPHSSQLVLNESRRNDRVTVQLRGLHRFSRCELAPSRADRRRLAAAPPARINELSRNLSTCLVLPIAGSFF